uniref:Uncharacterized protein n=1 Tax=Ditylenchus dipsaci TaxID=166011 RepID=A0A915EM75_9BILA
MNAFFGFEFARDRENTSQNLIYIYAAALAFDISSEDEARNKLNDYLGFFMEDDSGHRVFAAGNKDQQIKRRVNNFLEWNESGAKVLL